MTTVKVANADRMIIAVTPGEQGINASFADGYSGIVPFTDIPEIGDFSKLDAVELPNPYEIILTNTQDERVELPWDFVRHYCDLTYRPRMEMVAVKGRQILGSRVRRTPRNRRLDPRGSCPSRGHRAYHTGAAGKRKTCSETHHAEGHSPGPGEASRRPARWP